MLMGAHAHASGYECLNSCKWSRHRCVLFVLMMPLITLLMLIRPPVECMMPALVQPSSVTHLTVLQRDHFVVLCPAKVRADGKPVVCDEGYGCLVGFH